MAMVMRGYFIEGYKMPTGSMAANIIGAHADTECPNCGCKSAVSLSDWQALELREELNGRCANCGEALRIVTTAEMLPGDRFILDKTTSPRRWSPVAFHKPPEREEIYMKRLVGLPGETVELAGGEVFIDGKLLRKEPHVATDLWIPLHDTDFVPNAIDDDTPHWQPRDEQGGWRQVNTRWTVESAGDEFKALEFAGTITDVLSYNAEPCGQVAIPRHTLGDVLVVCQFASLSGDGTIRFEWAFAGSTVVADIEISGDFLIQTTAANGDRARARGRLPAPLSDGDSLAFAVRDGQAYFVKDGAVAALAKFGADDVASFASLAAADERYCKLALSAANCSLVLQRITIHRDVYYIGSADELGGGSDTWPPSWALAADEWFLLGDNSARSYDSRMFSDVRTSDLIGVAKWIYWPPRRWHELH